MWALPEPDGNRSRRPAAPDQAARLNPVRTLHICSFSIRSKTRPPPTRSGATRPVSLPGRRPHDARGGLTPALLDRLAQDRLDLAVVSTPGRAPRGVHAPPRPRRTPGRRRPRRAPAGRDGPVPLDLFAPTPTGSPAAHGPRAPCSTHPAAGVPSAGRACRRRVGRQAGVRGGRSRRRPGPGAGRRGRTPGHRPAAGARRCARRPCADGPWHRPPRASSTRCGKRWR